MGRFDSLDDRPHAGLGGLILTVQNAATAKMMQMDVSLRQQTGNWPQLFVLHSEWGELQVSAEQGTDPTNLTLEGSLGSRAYVAGRVVN